jgi:aspartate kinase
MTVLVQKYGGSSVAGAERIRAVAERVARSRAGESGAKLSRGIVVVVSAMGDTTDELIQLARSVTADPDPRELDLLLSTGETVSATLLAMALRALGCPAISLTAAQVGIRTNRWYSRARITAIHPERLQRELDAGKIAIVTGFQGITDEADITTLGRGGSDTTAVALACALGADRCEIYTDVQGIYTADPRIVPEAACLSQIAYEEMLELAVQGAKVMHPRSVELGQVYNMPIVVRSSFTEAPGTVIGPGDSMEIRRRVQGIAHDTDVAKISLAGVPDRPGIAHALFAPLAEAGVSVDVIVQTASFEGVTDMSFTVARGDLERAVELVEPVAKDIRATKLASAPDLAKVSIVGTGIQSAPGYAARMFGILSDAGINIDMITTSDIRITCVVERGDVERAVRALHAGFELDKE